MSDDKLMTESIRLRGARYLRSIWSRRWYGVGMAWAVCAPLLKGIALSSDVDARLDRLQRTLLSNTNMKKVIRLTDLDLRMHDPADRERMVATLQKKIAIKLQSRNLFTVSYADTNPELAENVVSTLLSIFMEESAGGSRTDIDSAQRFLQSEIDRLETQLREDERKKAEFESRYYDLLPNAESGESRLEQARESVRQLTSDLDDAVAERDDLRKQIDATPAFNPAPTAVVPAGAAGLSTAPKTRLAQLQAQLEIAKSTMTDEHPLVISLKHQIELVEAELAAAKPTNPASSKIKNPIYRDLTIRLASKEADLAALRRRLATAGQDRDAIEDEARRTPGVEAEYLNLSRDYDVVKTNYEALLARRESADIAENADRRGDQVTVKTIDPPEVPVIPAGPNRPLFLSLAFVAGIGSGLFAAFMLGEMDESFSTTTALELLGLPVLGSIRHVDQPRLRTEFWLNGTLRFASACLTLAIVYASLMAMSVSLHASI
jgi:polysaccharide chain length determinant protein (PEP-CTERM system associated)